ncbi:hypothetical protein DY000_02032103 [Brassica cretica]|nr:hypothetical protein DY000_02032103 [Brassica cretica]
MVKPGSIKDTDLTPGWEVQPTTGLLPSFHTDVSAAVVNRTHEYRTRNVFASNARLLPLDQKVGYISKDQLGFSLAQSQEPDEEPSQRKPSPFTDVGMGRLHSKGKGISASALPYKRSPPSWLKTTSQDVDESICKFAKKGLTPSQIGVILRDSHGIPQVKSVTGNKILRILKAHGLAPEIPEDLYHLIKKAVAIRKHLERNRKDKDSKFRLILVESRIHRLARYYKKTKKLPPVWKYESTTASTLVA